MLPLGVSVSSGLGYN